MSSVELDPGGVMKCWAVMWAVVLLSSAVSAPAIAQRDQRARPVSPDVAQERVEPAPSVDREVKLRFLEDLVARATPGQRAIGAGTLSSWLAAHSVTLPLLRADVRLTPRDPYSQPPESFLRATEIERWSPIGPGGFIRDPSRLFVEFDPSASVGDLYLVDFTLYLEGDGVFHLSEWNSFCPINFKRDDTLPLSPGDQHLLAVIQFNEEYKCLLLLEETTGVGWGFLAWEATRLD